MRELDMLLYRLNNCVGDNKHKQVEVLENIVAHAQYEIQNLKEELETEKQFE